MISIFGSIGCKTATGTSFRSSSYLKRNFSSQTEEVGLRISPGARSALARNHLPLTTVKGTGKHGMILKEDVLRYLANPSASSSSSVSSKSSAVSSSKPSPKKPEEGNEVTFEEIPNSNMRKIIAQRLTLSKTTIPHSYMSIDVNANNLMQLRSSINEKGKVKLSVNDFIVKATSLALSSVPEVNSFWDAKKEEAVLQKTVDVSVAVATDKGLITPILKNSTFKSIADLSSEVQELAKKARENKLKPEEFQGGTFSISNLGMFSIESFSAVINPPQGAILAVGRGKPVVAMHPLTEKPFLTSQISLTLSFDERAISSHSAATFLEQLNSLLSNPHSLI